MSRNNEVVNCAPAHPRTKVTFKEDPYVRDRILRQEMQKWLEKKISYKEMKINVGNRVRELVEAN